MRIIIFFLFISVSVFGQQKFHYENNQVVWQNDFDTELTKEEIIEILKKDSGLSSVAKDFTGNSGRFQVVCEKSKFGLSFYTTMDFEKGKYRVKINEILVTPSRPDILFGGFPFDTLVPFERDQVDRQKGGLQTNRIAENSRECLDRFFLKKFSFDRTQDR